MKVGYFKVEPKVPVVVSPTKREISLPSNRKLVTSQSDKWKLLTLPVTGLVLALVLLGSMQVGVKLANYDLPREQYSSVAEIDLPSNVFFMASVYDSLSVFSVGFIDWAQDVWSDFFTNWRIFLGLEKAPTVLPSVSMASTTISLMAPELREQLRQQILSEIKAEQASSSLVFGGVVPADRSTYSVMALPTNGSTTIDESLKQKLRQTFADQVDIRFDNNGSSGTVTPIFQDGRRGDTYVFVLTPTH